MGTRIISRGSRPKTMEKWVGEDFTTVPIKRYLTPLSYLFKDEWLSKNEHYGFKRSLSGTKISKIFDDAHAKYCPMMLGDILDENCNIKVCNDYDCGLKGQCRLDIATQQPYCDCGRWAYGDHCEHVRETCDDGKMNQEELDIDCGGPCEACKCVIDEECPSAVPFCIMNTCGVTPPDERQCIRKCPKHGCQNFRCGGSNCGCTNCDKGCTWDCDGSNEADGNGR